MSHEEDGGANDAFKEARGLTAVDVHRRDRPRSTWRIQGNQGGEDIADPVRGPLNNGGLYGERAGWYLPGYPRRAAGRRSRCRTPTRGPASPGTGRRSGSTVPAGADASLGLTITDDRRPSPTGRRSSSTAGTWASTSTTSARSTRSCCRTACCAPHGDNTLAIAVLSDGTTPGGLGSVTLANLGTVSGGVPVLPVFSPSHAT